MSLLVDLARALGQLGDPRFRRVLLRALGLTIAALALVFWAVMLAVGWLLPETVTLPWIGEVGFLDSLVSSAAVGLMLVLSVVLMVPAAAAAVGFFLDDIAAAVEARHYPALPPVTGLGLGQQAADALGFLGLVVVANLVALAIYLMVRRSRRSSSGWSTASCSGASTSASSRCAGSAGRAPRRCGGATSGGSGSRAPRWRCR